MRRTALSLVLSASLISLTGCSWFKKDKDKQAMDQQYNDPYAAPPGGGGYQPLPHERSTSAPMGGGRTHIVAKGETLYAIARQEYGDQSKWKNIYEANRNEIPDKDHIRVGQRLTLP
ncbi:MAG: LysM peptidoglycan-binding domain-containing protein [Planctomycetes bacterium]|nr:LysM peptidoglycan-binding domain-containing protein [Planctomycetota bacterium]